MSDNFDVYAWKRNRLLESLTEGSDEKEYRVRYWLYRNDDYDDFEVTVKASSKEEAIEKAKEEVGKGKNFEVIFINDEYVGENKR